MSLNVESSISYSFINNFNFSYIAHLLKKCINIKPRLNLKYNHKTEIESCVIFRGTDCSRPMMTSDENMI